MSANQHRSKLHHQKCKQALEAASTKWRQHNDEAKRLRSALKLASLHTQDCSLVHRESSDIASLIEQLDSSIAKYEKENKLESISLSPT